jgi:hypothetical protein
MRGADRSKFPRCLLQTELGFQCQAHVILHALRVNLSINSRIYRLSLCHRGTSWAGLPFPGVYTRYALFCNINSMSRLYSFTNSYDYGASIRENRALSAKFDELKRQGLFLRSSPEFRKTDWIGDSSTGGVSVNESAAFVTFLRNPDSSTGFYIARQKDSTSTYVQLCPVLFHDRF